VPVDRSDPVDDPNEPAHRRPPDGVRSSEISPLPLDPADLDAVHRANRAKAEQAYATHNQGAPDRTSSAGADIDRDRWAEAVPSLRAAWEEHQNRYPERERGTPNNHPDGSWSSGETRRLTPEQNTEATKACADIHDEGERDIPPPCARSRPMLAGPQ
jgi:hypothetical protein